MASHVEKPINKQPTNCQSARSVEVIQLTNILHYVKIIVVLGSESILHVCIGARILTVLPFPGRSHHHLFQRLVIELAERGHQVTYISPFPQPKPVANLTDITIPNVMESVMQQVKKDINNASLFTNNPGSSPLILFAMPTLGLHFMKGMLEMDAIKEFMKSDNEFDLVIGESIMDECLLGGFSQKFKAPIIAVSPFMANLWSSYMVGNPIPTAYVPETMLGFSPKMPFIERLLNTVAVFLVDLYHVFIYMPAQDALMRKYFGHDLPPLHQIIKNVSLVLVNHHRSLAFPRPYLPNMVEIGGFHVSPPKPLTSDLQKFMDESENGVILFSMGTILQSSEMPPEMKETFLNAFSRLKQDVLWKFEDESETNLPKNVKISKWLPQSDVLAHLNLRLFITHGGLLSTTEAIVRGVPMVGIPVTGDQPLNMKQMVNLGLGVTVDIKTITEDILYEAVTEVLSNPKYSEAAKFRSQIMRDTPLSAIDTALYWIEYVIRYKGAPHLRSAAQDLAWHQLYLLDVLGVLALGLAALVGLSILILKLVRNWFCSKKSKKIASTGKKND